MWIMPAFASVEPECVSLCVCVMRGEWDEQEGKGKELKAETLDCHCLGSDAALAPVCPRGKGFI